MASLTKHRVLLSGSEFNPLAKAGGLADVLAGLPLALRELPSVQSAVVALPFYETIDKSLLKSRKKIDGVEVKIGKQSVKVSVWEATVKATNQKLLLFHNFHYLSRSRPYDGTAVMDPITGRAAKTSVGQRLRFLVFSFAVHAYLKKHPAAFTIVHCHDYHTAPLNALLALQPVTTRTGRVRSLLTIHNLGITGAAPKEYIDLFAWGEDISGAEAFETKEYLREGGPRLLIAGLVHTDAVTTVSPTYAKEIIKPSQSSDLSKLLKRRKNIYGILNGLDLNYFNPATDPDISHHFSVLALKKKLANKQELQQSLGLVEDNNIPLLGIVHRLTWQKGLDLFLADIDRLAELPLQVVIIGTGDKALTAGFEAAAQKYDGQVAFINVFDLPLSQRIFAASDLFLMPSRYEPCGLSQVIAMRYGALPIVRATGGLVDTVAHNITGFSFKPLTSAALWRTIERAVALYHTDPTAWTKMQKAAMRSPQSWDGAAKQYTKVYTSITKP